MCSIGSDNVDLNDVGVVGKAFSVAVGSQLNDDFKKIRGLKEGSVVLTKVVGLLKCKALLYVGIRAWKGDKMVCSILLHGIIFTKV